MLDYKYIGMTKKNYTCNSFEDFLSWQYNKSFNKCPTTIQVLKDGSGVGYYPDNLKFGNQYFIGAQYFKGDHYGEYGDATAERFKLPYGVYKLIGVENGVLSGVEFAQALIFEDRFGKQVTVLPRTTVLKKKRLMQFQADDGFWFPPCLKEEWPDLVENKRHIRSENPYEIADRNPQSRAREVFDAVVLLGGLSLIATVFVLGFYWKAFFKAISTPPFGTAATIGAAIIPFALSVLFVAWDAFVVFVIVNTIKTKLS